MNFMQLVDKGLEWTDFGENLLFGSAGPWTGFGAEFLKTVAEKTGLLFVEIEALGIVLFIDSVENEIKIGLNVIEHLINLCDSLRDFSILYFTYLNNINTGLFNGLNMTVSDLFNVGNQFRIVFVEGLPLGVESCANIIELRRLLVILLFELSEISR